MGRDTTATPIPTKQNSKNQNNKKPIANQHFIDLLIREGVTARQQKLLSGGVGENGLLEIKNRR